MKKHQARLNLLKALFRLSPSGLLKACVMLLLHGVGINRPFTLRIQRRTIHFPSVSELYTAKQILLDHIYDISLDDVHRIADLGANIGLASIFFAQRFPNATIDAYEPDPQTFKYLQANAKGLNIICHQRAIAAEAGEAYFYRAANSVASSLTPSAAALEKVRVQTMTPEDVGIVDLLKIDIEGAESQLVGHSFRARAVVGESTESDVIAQLFRGLHLQWRSQNGVFSAT